MNNSVGQIVFWNKDGKRLRPLWRIGIQMLGLLGVIVFLSFWLAVAVLVFHWRPSDSALFIISTLMELVAILASVGLAWHFLSRRPLQELGLQVDRKTGPSLLYGFILGLVIWALVAMTMQRLGWLHFAGFAAVDPGQLALYLGLMIVVGFQEELLCRGYFMQTLASGWNVAVAVVGSALLFSGLHMLNPGFSWMAFAGIFLAGLLLAFAARRTGRLWLSIGLHIGWNFFEAVVFGLPVSGLTIYHLMQVKVTGPALWTGGAFGPEAGLIILPALALGAGLVWAFTKKGSGQK